MTRPGLAVFLLALALRLAWIATLDEHLTWLDEQEFATVARHLAAGEGYVSTTFRANPVLPAYLAVVFRTVGESHLAARVGQAVMGALTCVLIMRIAARLFGPTVGTVSGLLLALYLPHIYLSGVFYVECLFTLLIALTVFLALRTLDAEAHAVRWSVATGLSFGLTVLTRPIFLAYLPFLAATLLWNARARPGRACAIATTLVLATALPILPWTLRNIAVHGKPILVSGGFGTKLWQGNNEGAVGDADDREMSFTLDVWRARLRAYDEPERTAIATRYQEAERRIDALRTAGRDAYDASDTVLGPLAVSYIATHPRRTVELFLWKLWTLFQPFTKTLVTNADTTARNRLLATIATLPMFAFALLGLWRSAGQTRSLTILYGLIASLAVAYGILTSCTRFRLPLDPYLIVFAAFALVDLWQRRSGKRGEERA